MTAVIRVLYGDPRPDGEPPPFTEYPDEAAAEVRNPIQPRRFALVPFDKIQLTTTRDYLVKNIVPREALVLVWGPPKSGKSFFVYDVAMHVALGQDYRGRRVAQGPVVYVACEGERGIGARTAAFREAKLAENHDPVPFYLAKTSLDLRGQFGEVIDDVRAQLGDEKPAAIVIDTLNRSLRGSENSDEDMSDYIKAALAVRDAFRCSVIVIHHCGHDGTRPRGHTSLLGGVDAQIAVRQDKDGLVTATVEAMRDGPSGETVASRLKVVEVGTDEDGAPITSCVVEPTDGAAATPGRAKKVNAAAKQALELLHQAMADAAAPAPASEHIPAGMLTVTKPLWRTYCEKGGILNPDGNPREQLRRIVVTLKDAGLIGVWDDFVWPVTSRHKASP